MGSKEPEVLLVHRSRWEDWSFPKGKHERGEESYTAAVREVREETGLSVSLGPRLPGTLYTMSSGEDKNVDYWCARAPGHADIAAYEPNAEIDDLRWVPVSRAPRKLSYPYDRDLLEAFTSTPYDTSPLIVVRHGHAHSRKAWQDDDSERPLDPYGQDEAYRLIPLLGAYGINRIVSSDALRCVASMLPYANTVPVDLRLDPSLSEAAYDVHVMTQRMRTELDRFQSVAVCTHRPLLPAIQRALGLEPVPLEPGALLVLHRRDGRVHSVEHHTTAIQTASQGRKN